MKNCPGCKKDNNDTALFCTGCGEDLSEVQPTGVASAVAQIPAVAPVPDPLVAANATFAVNVTTTTGQPAAIALPSDVITTLNWDNGDPDNPQTLAVPLCAGQTLTIAREGTNDGTPDLAIPSPGVPRKLVKVTAVGDGKLLVEDTGSSVGFMIAKKVKPGQSGELVIEDGEYLIFGNEFVFTQ